MGQLSRQIAVLVLLAGGLVATAIAGPKPDPAPIQEARPIPLAGENSSGELDIDFRSSGWSFFTNVDGLQEATKGIVSVTASEGVLRSDACDRDPDPAPAPDPNCPTGFAVYDVSTTDEGLEKRETLIVEIKSSGIGTAAFDVNGVWLSGFVQDKKENAGEIELFGVNDADGRAYSFSWNDIDPNEPNPDNEFFVGFGETRRITSAVLTATSGAFSVAGFSQQPIMIVNDECEQDEEKPAVDKPSVDKPGCFAEIARNVFLDILPRTGGVEGEGAPGDRGVSGELIKNGVYIVVDDIRDQCQPGFDPADSAYELWGTLPIDLDGDKDEDNDIYELVMQKHQCGYPDPENLDNPNQPVIYILDMNGSDLKIVEDTIAVKFNDDGDDPEPPGDYFCNASDAFQRPGYGWVPHGQRNGGADDYEEIPLLGVDGMALLGTDDLPNPVQDITTGPCGSGRGGFSRFSYVVYHWVNAPGTPYEITVGERIDRLQVYVGQLFPCVQQGINQSALRDDAGHIRKSFDMGRYQRAVDYIAEMREHVLAPRLNEEISQCFFDLVLGNYVKEAGASGVDANVVGNLLVQLDHLRWMIRSTLLGEMPGDIPKLD
jgi:hypothetical protein